jgi:hypothetical protein
MYEIAGLVVERSKNTEEVLASVLKRVDRGMWGLPGWERPPANQQPPPIRSSDEWVVLIAQR